MSELQRYHRQMLLPAIGQSGQRRLREAHALLVGCGALGTVIADLLARAGIGALTIVDRDLVELTNLQRQILFDERDVEQAMPKAEAAKRKLAQVNHEVAVHAHVVDFNASNAAALADNVDIIVDGLDNFETRYLLNDLAVKGRLPFVYGGAVGTTGMSMTILPHAARGFASQHPSGSHISWSDNQSTPCLRCIFPDAPPPGSTPTCDTAGVLCTVVMQIAAHQVTQAIKLITGNLDALDRSLLSIDTWTGTMNRFDVSNARAAGSDCPCCVHGRFDFLEGPSIAPTTLLCGRNAVQITPAPGADGAALRLDFAQVAGQLAPHGEFTHNAYLLRGTFAHERDHDGHPLELTLFPDGRAIIKGISEATQARAVYARYIGA
jgi:adenylyltransferase/sulfurtransferase